MSSSSREERFFRDFHRMPPQKTQKNSSNIINRNKPVNESQKGGHNFLTSGTPKDTVRRQKDNEERGHGDDDNDDEEDSVALELALRKQIALMKTQIARTAYSNETLERLIDSEPRVHSNNNKGEDNLQSQKELAPASRTTNAPRAAGRLQDEEGIDTRAVAHLLAGRGGGAKPSYSSTISSSSYPITKKKDSEETRRDLYAISREDRRSDHRGASAQLAEDVANGLLDPLDYVRRIAQEPERRERESERGREGRVRAQHAAGGDPDTNTTDDDEGNEEEAFLRALIREHRSASQRPYSSSNRPDRGLKKDATNEEEGPGLANLSAIDRVNSNHNHSDISALVVGRRAAGEAALRSPSAAVDVSYSHLMRRGGDWSRTPTPTHGPQSSHDEGKQPSRNRTTEAQHSSKTPRAPLSRSGSFSSRGPHPDAAPTHHAQHNGLAPSDRTSESSAAVGDDEHAAVSVTDSIVSALKLIAESKERERDLTKKRVSSIKGGIIGDEREQLIRGVAVFEHNGLSSSIEVPEGRSPKEDAVSKKVILAGHTLPNNRRGVTKTESQQRVSNSPSMSIVKVGSSSSAALSSHPPQPTQEKTFVPILSAAAPENAESSSYLPPTSFLPEAFVKEYGHVISTIDKYASLYHRQRAGTAVSIRGGSGGEEIGVVHAQAAVSSTSSTSPHPSSSKTMAGAVSSEKPLFGQSPDQRQALRNAIAAESASSQVAMLTKRCDTLEDLVRERDVMILKQSSEIVNLKRQLRAAEAEEEVRAAEIDKMIEAEVAQQTATVQSFYAVIADKDERVAALEADVARLTEELRIKKMIHHSQQSGHPQPRELKPEHNEESKQGTHEVRRASGTREAVEPSLASKSDDDDLPVLADAIANEDDDDDDDAPPRRSPSPPSNTSILKRSNTKSNKGNNRGAVVDASTVAGLVEREVHKALQTVLGDTPKARRMSDRGYHESDDRSVTKRVTIVSPEDRKSIQQQQSGSQESQRSTANKSESAVAKEDARILAVTSAYGVRAKNVSRQGSNTPVRQQDSFNEAATRGDESTSGRGITTYVGNTKPAPTHIGAIPVRVGTTLPSSVEVSSSKAAPRYASPSAARYSAAVADLAVASRAAFRDSPTSTIDVPPSMLYEEEGNRPSRSGPSTPRSSSLPLDPQMIYDLELADHKSLLHELQKSKRRHELEVAESLGRSNSNLMRMMSGPSSPYVNDNVDATVLSTAHDTAGGGGVVRRGVQSSDLHGSHSVPFAHVIPTPNIAVAGHGPSPSAWGHQRYASPTPSYPSNSNTNGFLTPRQHSPNTNTPQHMYRTSSADRSGSRPPPLPGYHSPLATLRQNGVITTATDSPYRGYGGDPTTALAKVRSNPAAFTDFNSGATASRTTSTSRRSTSPYIVGGGGGTALQKGGRGPAGANFPPRILADYSDYLTSVHTSL